MVTVTRPPLRYHGGKWLLGPWIADHFPKHHTYVEPFGGGGNLLLRKIPAPNEIYNDLDSHVVNLFRVLRSPVLSDELVRVLELTPYSCEEYEQAEAMHRGGSIPDCPVERARRTVFYAAASYGGYTPARKLQFRRILHKRSGAPLPKRYYSLIDTLHQVTKRLRNVVIENMNGLELLKIYDSPETLFYLDPPYLHRTRSSRNGYGHEMTLADHEALLSLIQELQGFVVLSGYPDAFYDTTLKSWHRVEKEECRTIGAKYGEQSRKLEVLWLNPQCVRALEKERQQLQLFEGDA